jgi:hypothetical protein
LLAIDKLTGTSSGSIEACAIGAGLGVDPTFFRARRRAKLLVALGQRVARRVLAWLPAAQHWPGSACSWRPPDWWRR